MIGDDNMLYIDKYNGGYTCIQIDNKEYCEIEEKDILQGQHTAGVGGMGEDGKLYALYLEQGNIYFQVENDVYEIDSSDFACTNNYIDDNNRLFKLDSKGENICTVKYKPFVDPGMLFYDAEEDEFDVLLYLSSLLASKERLEGFRQGRSRCR